MMFNCIFRIVFQSMLVDLFSIM